MKNGALGGLGNVLSAFLGWRIRMDNIRGENIRRGFVEFN
jgi:hypothetical protein